MGSYASCWLGDIEITWTKNDVDYGIMSLFRSSDKFTLSAINDDLPAKYQDYRERADGDDRLFVVYYEISANIIKDRLEVAGYNLETAKEAFRLWVSAEIERLEAWTEKSNSENLGSFYQSRIDVLRSMTPESWMDGLNTIKKDGLKRESEPHSNALIEYMLTMEKDFYGFPGYDSFIFLRLALEVFGAETTLEYDLTDLVWAGYFDYDEDIAERGISISAQDYSGKARTIVLTEGKSDARILKNSLELLYPHLSDHFSFLDFEGTAVEGGVGSLANMVKAFAGVGIVNNVLALFDNDTAATAACKIFERITLPPNIVIRRLPDIPLLKNYPTLGPSGETMMDVNGIAASLELYLGEDVLKLDGFQLTPVQWTGYDRRLKQYQGEVLAKGEIQERFEDKMKYAFEGKDADWSGLRAIFDVIFHAFDENNRAHICGMPVESEL